MKTIQVSDEIYDRMREFVVDPFDDTPENIISRLIGIACKAKNRWSTFEPRELDGDAEQPQKMASRARMTNQDPEDAEVML